ncbi:hypothetical protein BJ878DRAFT_246995 [Calycina marina]|uniref:FAS1 domain-containing protein n=1 Tax=Calycina marina TaxID=1763456 RepID=A0A9P7Z8H4_9HELO|nr:hypothetical protein BJ878DRAFT_246995 [Calycina marina]
MRLSLVTLSIFLASLHHVSGEGSPQFLIKAHSQSQPDLHSKTHTKNRLPSNNRAFYAPDFTIYELLSVLPSTSKLASFTSGRPTLINLLNSTATNLTLFAPCDSSFSKIEREMTEDDFRYHLVPYPFSLALLLGTGITTLPSLLYPERLNGPQRFTFDFVTSELEFILNSHAYITTFDFHASNGHRLLFATASIDL